jgi:hypothetical protein
MDGISAAPHNNAVQHYFIRDNVHLERRYLQLRAVTVRGDRLREKVLLKESPVEHVNYYRGRRRKSIVGASELQFSDGLYAEVPF